MILLIDNYDSFVFNLQRYFVRLGHNVCVVRNDDPRLGEALRQARQQSPNPFADWPTEPTAIVISPGPRRPADAGYCLEAVRIMSGTLPILGVCLGHQVIYEAFGGQVVRSGVPVHGCATPMRLEASRLFADLPQGPSAAEIQFARYHSLIAEPQSLPPQLQIIARSVDGHIMAVEHRQHATYGVQFHPESILSPDGYRVLHNFLKIAGLPVADGLPPADWLPDPAAAARLAEISNLHNQSSTKAGTQLLGEAGMPSETGPPAEVGPFASLPTAGNH